MLPVHISCRDYSVSLFRLKHGRYQPISDGAIAPLMIGFQYVLAEHALASFLGELNIERIRIEPAIIWERDKNTEAHNHCQIYVGQTFSSDQINDLNLDGRRLLLMDESYLFSSPELAETLDRSEFDYLEFSIGLNRFG